MGITKEYLDYLDREVGISPAGSQEELDCARTIADVFSSHGLEPQVQEFSVPSFGGVVHGALMVLALVGLVLSGLTGAAKVIGVLLAAATLVLLFMVRSGRDVLGRLGPTAHSQNVVALHQAEGDDVAHNRPIVILAHYDSPRVDHLARREVSVAKKYLAQGSPYLAGISAFCLFVQILLFLPAGARRTFWIIGIVATLPLAVWGATLIARRFTPYTSGAVDNKSSIAAMLGVLERVRPSGPARRAAARAASSADSELVRTTSDGGAERTESVPVMRREVEKVVGVRHGKRVLEELGILPSTCEITYVEPEVRMVPVAGVSTPLHPDATGAEAVAPTVSQPRPRVSDEGEDRDAAMDEVQALPSVPAPAPASDATSAMAVGNVVPERSVTNGDEADAPADDGDAAEADEPAAGERTPDAKTSDAADQASEDDGAQAAADATAALPTEPVENESANSTRPLARPAARRIRAERIPSPSADPGATAQVAASDLSQLENGQDETEGPVVETDQSGLGVMVEEDSETASEAPRAPRPRPAAPADPEWGKSSYAPACRRDISGIGRRAALFDLPDPLSNDEDALAPHTASRPASTPSDSSVKVSAPTAQRVSQPTAQDEIRVLSATSESYESHEAPAPKRGIGKLFARRRKEETSMSEWLGVDDDYDAKESGEDIGSWDNFNDDERVRHGNHWKGGAALSLRLRDLKKAAEKAAEGAVTGVKDAASHIGRPSSASENLPADGDEGEQPAQQGTAAPQEGEPSGPGATSALVEPADGSVEALPVSEGEALPPILPVISAPDSEASQPTPSDSGQMPAVPTDEDMRDVVLAMGDEDLVAHDIWFVATGASAFDHAGVKDFLAANRKALRGAFVINLDCVGAGDLTILTHEGFGSQRRADRRLSSLLASVASDLHIGLGKLSRPWADTEATPLMRRSLRAVTIMGMGDNELPAFSGTAEDVYENVNVGNVADVSALVAEVIRRS